MDVYADFLLADTAAFIAGNLRKMPDMLVEVPGGEFRPPGRADVLSAVGPSRLHFRRRLCLDGYRDLSVLAFLV